MDKQEAKLILSTYTLDNQPQGDERFDAALKLAHADPSLMDWWKAQCEEDALLQSAFRSVPVPEDLNSALKETLAHQASKPSLFAYFRNWAAIAACLAFSVYLFFAYAIDRSDDYQGPLLQRAYDYSVDGPRLTYFDRDTQNMRQWLTAEGFDLPAQLPPKLLELEGIGCRPLKWSGDGVALMCFQADTVYHLFIGKQEDFPSFEASENIGYDSYAGGWTVGKWKEGNKLFVLTAQTPVDSMQSMLATYQPADPSTFTL